MVSYDEEDEDSDIFGESDGDDDDDDEDNTGVCLLRLYLVAVTLKSFRHSFYLPDSDRRPAVFCRGTGSTHQRRRCHETRERSRM